MTKVTRADKLVPECEVCKVLAEQLLDEQERTAALSKILADTTDFWDTLRRLVLDPRVSAADYRALMGRYTRKPGLLATLPNAGPRDPTP